MITQQHADVIIEKICYFIKENQKKAERIKKGECDWTEPTHQEIIDKFSLPSHEFYVALFELISEEESRVRDAKCIFRNGQISDGKTTKAYRDMEATNQLLETIKGLLELGHSMLPSGAKCDHCDGIGFVLGQKSFTMVPCPKCATHSVSKEWPR